MCEVCTLTPDSSGDMVNQVITVQAKLSLSRVLQQRTLDNPHGVRTVLSRGLFQVASSQNVLSSDTVRSVVSVPGNTLPSSPSGMLSPETGQGNRGEKNVQSVCVCGGDCSDGRQMDVAKGTLGRLRAPGTSEKGRRERC